MCVPGWDEKARGQGCPVAAGAIAGGPEPRGSGAFLVLFVRPKRTRRRNRGPSESQKMKFSNHIWPMGGLFPSSHTRIKVQRVMGKINNCALKK